MTVLGIDVSHYQGEVNWHRVAQSDFCFAYIKASEGSTHEDARFLQNWSRARDVGVLHGAYHFGHPGSDPEAQAAHFAALVGAPAWNELPPVLDLETADNQSSQTVIEWTLAFVRAAEVLFGRPLMIYTGGFWRNRLGDPSVPELASRLLWSARYSTKEPVVPNTWKRWDFWQFTDGQHGAAMQVPGVRTRCDCNRFRGDLTELTSLTAPPSIDVPSSPEPAAGPTEWPGQFFVWPRQPAIRNEHVRAWQRRMCEHGYIISVDGAYGPESKSACIAFQRETGLVPDGIVGRETWKSAFSAPVG